MAKKTEPQRAIDVKGLAGNGLPFTPTGISVRPGLPTPPAPQGFAVDSNVAIRSGASPMSLVTFSWLPVPQINRFAIQIARDASFLVDLRTYIASGTSAGTELPSNVTFYARIRSESTSGPSAWSSAISFTTASDATVPAALTGIAWSWAAAGDLVISWNLPTDEATRTVEVKIWDSVSKTTLYRTLQGISSVVWTAAMNKADSASIGDTAVYVELQPVSWQNVYGLAQTPGTQPSLASPTTPTSLVQSWSGDAGTAPADLVISWTGSTSASGYLVTLDSVQYTVTGTRFVYTFAQNKADHSGTPDPVISIDIKAVNGLGGQSTSLTGTATNAAPAAPSSVQIIAVPGAIVAIVSATEPADFQSYRYRIIQTSPSASDITIDTKAKVVQQSLATAATYQVGVKVMDVFGQLSSETLSSATGLDLTISTLRADIIYSDVLGTAPATLKAALADEVIGSGGVSYTSSANWRYITAERALLDRYRFLTVAMWQVSGSTTWYIRTSTDASTWRYFAGPVTSSRILTEVADQTAARAAPVALATLGNSTSNRVELPSTVESRYEELWFLNSTGTTRIDEFYPRRLVQADDIQAQTLSAISGNLGTITAGTINSVTINSSTITGSTIQTAASGARVVIDSSGLKTYDSLGNVQVEATTATNGTLTAGAGDVAIDRLGIRVNAALSTLIADKNSYAFTVSGSKVSGVEAYQDTSFDDFHTIQMRAASRSGFKSNAYVIAEAPSGFTARAQLQANSGGTLAGIVVTATSGGTPECVVSTGLSVSDTGNTLNTPDGNVKVRYDTNDSGFTEIRNANAGSSAYAFLRMSNDGSTDAGLLRNSSANAGYGGANGLSLITISAHPITIVTNNAVRMRFTSGGAIGFFGGAGATRQNVAGSKAGNAALASLIDALVSYGLIADLTT